VLDSRESILLAKEHEKLTFGLNTVTTGW